jgi:hypothetical protein
VLDQVIEGLNENIGRAKPLFGPDLSIIKDIMIENKGRGAES